LKDLDAEVVFLCNYDLPEIFLTALWLRARGRSPVLMSDSKFDDKPRRLHRELRKWAALLPYRSALVGGHRAESYLRYLGFRRRPIAHGYDTVSTSRIRANAGAPPAPEGARFDERHWLVIARLVPKKNLFMLLDAYAMYCTKTGERRRRLTICGSGPLENDLRREASRRGLDRVVFTGWLQEPHVDEHLAQALALLLPSYEEQWGLAVNEATAMGLPVFCTPQVGAGDALVRAHVNGFLLESDNAVGWANAMVLLDGDEARWRTFCNESRRRSAIGDVTAFGDGVRQLLDLVP
jgi:glycosyltransferase involved in cell wall biosynthesis